MRNEGAPLHSRDEMQSEGKVQVKKKPVKENKNKGCGKVLSKQMEAAPVFSSVHEPGNVKK